MFNTDKDEAVVIQGIKDCIKPNQNLSTINITKSLIPIQLLLTKSW